MQIEYVEIENYGSFYGRHVFRLANQGLVFVRGENRDEPRMNSNGAAKSTMFEAVDWCLSGKIPRDDHVDSIVNEEAGKDCGVRVHLRDDDGTEIVVYRYRRLSQKVNDKVSGVALTVGGVERTAQDDAETTHLIERYLGLDRDVFHAAVFFAQSDIKRFADSKNAEQMEMLTKVLQLGQVDVWAARVGAKRKPLKERLDTQELLVQRSSGELEALRRVDYAQQTAAWESDRQQRLAQAQQQFELLGTRLSALYGQLQDPNALQGQLTALQQAEPRESLEVQQLRMAIVKAGGALTTAGGLAIAARRRAAEARQKIQRAQSARGTTCGACGQVITGDHVQQEVQRLSEEAARADAELQQAELSGQQVTEHKAALEASLQALAVQFATQQKEHAVQIDRLRTSLAALNENLRAYHQGSAQLQTLQGTVARVQAEVNPFVAKELELQRARAEAEQKLAQAQREVMSSRQELQYLDFWAEAFGPSGLKNYILDTKLQAITDAANHWVRILTGGTIWVRLETQTQGRTKGTLWNAINIRIFRYMRDGSVRERNYRSWSGGEKQRVSLGIDLGLASLIAARATKRYDVVIFDELFRHLDAAGREAVMDMLRGLRQEKSSVFVVDHDAEFAAQFERQVLVRKEYGRSVILQEEVSHDCRPGRDVPKANEGRAEQGGAVPANKRVPRRTPVQAA